MLPVLNLLTGQKSFLARETWHGPRARGSAWPSKISPKLVQGCEFGTQNVKNFHFLIVASQGRTL